MKYTSLGLPAVDGGTTKQRVASVKGIRKAIKDKVVAERVINAERQATTLRSQLAKARISLRKKSTSAALSRKVDRLAADLRRQRATATQLRAALGAADQAAVRQIVDIERRHELHVGDVVVAEGDVHEPRHRAARVGVAVVVDALDQGRRTVADSDDCYSYRTHGVGFPSRWCCSFAWQPSVRTSWWWVVDWWCSKVTLPRCPAPR